MIARLIRAGGGASRNSLFDALVESAANGLRMLGRDRRRDHARAAGR